MIQSMEIDADDDGTVDYTRLEVRVPIKSTERVHKVWALALFEYKLEDFVEVEWEAAAVVDEQSSLPGRGLVVDGEFYLHQRDLFSAFQKKYVSLCHVSLSLLIVTRQQQQQTVPHRHCTPIKQCWKLVWMHLYKIFFQKISCKTIRQETSCLYTNIDIRFGYHTHRKHPSIVPFRTLI